MSQRPDRDGQTSFPGGERVAFLLALTVALYLAYLTIRPVLVVVLVAASLGSLTLPVYQWVVRRLRGRPRLGAALTTLCLFAVVIGPLSVGAALLIARLTSEAGKVAYELRHDGTLSTIQILANRLGPLGPPIERGLKALDPYLAKAVPGLLERVGELASSLGKATVNLAIALFLSAVTLYYFYINAVPWRERLVRLLPLRPDDTRLFLSRFRQVSAAVLLGNVGTALVQGAAATAGYFMIGTPAPLIWGAVTTLAALVPLVGTVLVWLPLAVFMGISQVWWRGLLLGLYGVLIIGTIDNVLRPLLTRRGLRTHPLFVFLALFGGVAAFGPIGILTGPLSMALTITLIDLYERRLSPPTERFPATPPQPRVGHESVTAKGNKRRPDRSAM